jgi:endonuclease/exonuclease/phosphatase family metal-dependent hydrolase
MKSPHPIRKPGQSAVFFFPIFIAISLGWFAPPHAVSADNPEVRIMTWNIRYDNPDDGVHAWPKRRDTLAAFVRSQNPDVFCIQEGLVGQVNFLKESLSGFEVRGIGRDDGKEKGEFSAIYFKKFRFTCLADGTFWLSPSPSTPSKGWDAALPRIVTWVKLQDSLTAATFLVFNTHFDHMGVQARDSSAILIRRMISTIAGNLPYLVTGDFNSTETDSPYKLLTSRESSLPILIDAAQSTQTPHQGPLATFTGFDIKKPDPGEQIDYIFGEKSIRANAHRTLIAHRAEGFLSDHLPVMAIVTIPGNK